MTLYYLFFRGNTQIKEPSKPNPSSFGSVSIPTRLSNLSDDIELSASWIGALLILDLIKTFSSFSLLYAKTRASIDFLSNSPW